MSPETGRPVEELPLRERLALQGRTMADKLPPPINPLYNAGFGTGMKGGTQPTIVDMIGKKRRKVEDSDDEEEFKEARPREPINAQASKRPARNRQPARQRAIIESDSESSSVHFDDDEDEWMGY